MLQVLLKTVVKKNITWSSRLARKTNMYTIVFPVFQKFRKYKRLEEIHFIPKCYRTFDEQGSEVIVLENLKQSKYKLHDKFTPMAYGEWHALSFAIQDQNKKEFDHITSSFINVIREFMKHEGSKSVLDTGRDRASKALNEHGDHDLLRKLNKVTEKGAIAEFLAMILGKPDKAIISHGDCCNNNFLFKYGSNTAIPEKVAILDWQASFLRSPVFDLSYFIYSVASKKEFDQFDNLMDIYYNSLSDSIRKLGSDPAKLFTKEELLDYWRKYSLYGFLTGLVVMQLEMRELGDAPSFGNLTIDQNFETVTTNLEIRQKGAYYKRIRDIVEHYTFYNNI